MSATTPGGLSRPARTTPGRIAILGSGSGTTAARVIDAVSAGDISADVADADDLDAPMLDVLPAAEVDLLVFAATACTQR